MSPKRPRKSSLSLISTNWAAKRLTGITLGLLDRRSREVTWRVWSSVHRTSSVNSTEHSGQKSSQVQSLDDRGTRERHWKDAGLSLLANSWRLPLSTAVCLQCHHSWGVWDLTTSDAKRRQVLSSTWNYSKDTRRQNSLSFIPTLCATNSSWSTDEFASIWIQSMAENIWEIIFQFLFHLIGEFSWIWLKKM